MKKCSKIICMLLVMVAILSTTMVFAEGESGAYNILANVLNALLSALAWFGYAIAIGALVFMGIKYVMSGAQEKANLKGSLSKYLIGIALIVFCSTIASAVANIANTDGGNDAISLIKKAFRLGGATVGDPSTTDPAGDVDDENSKNSNINYYPASAAPKASTRLAKALANEGYYGNKNNTVVSEEYHKGTHTLEKRTLKMEDGKMIVETYDIMGNLKTIAIKDGEKEIKKASVDYKNTNGTVKSIRINSKENGQKTKVTINYDTETGNVIMYAKYDDKGNLLESEVYKDELPEGKTEYDELPKTPSLCEAMGKAHVPNGNNVCINCGEKVEEGTVEIPKELRNCELEGKLHLFNPVTGECMNCGKKESK